MITLYKTFLTIIIFSSLSASSHALYVAKAMDNTFDGTCDGNECSLTATNHPLAKVICEGSPPSVFWKKNSPLYLVQCDCDCSMHQNKNWVLDKFQKKIYGLSYGRYVTTSFMKDATASTEIPDLFASVRLCDAPNRKKLLSSNFVLLNKLPSEGKSPYCYEATYLEINADKLIIYRNTGIISDNNYNYWMKDTPTSQSAALWSLVESIH